MGRVPTLGQWLEPWLETIAARKVARSTLDSYQSKVTSAIVPGLGGHRLDRLQPEHVERLYAAQAARGLAPATVLQYHRILSRALTVAVQRGKVARNVYTLVDTPSLVHHEVEPLTGAEACRILPAAEGTWNDARWSVALALGLRQGEALGLTWGDVDLDAGTVRVRQALSGTRGSTAAAPSTTARTPVGVSVAATVRSGTAADSRSCRRSRGRGGARSPRPASSSTRCCPTAASSYGSGSRWDGCGSTPTSSSLSATQGARPRP